MGLLQKRGSSSDWSVQWGRPSHVSLYGMQPPLLHWKYPGLQVLLTGTQRLPSASRFRPVRHVHATTPLTMVQTSSQPPFSFLHGLEEAVPAKYLCCNFPMRIFVRIVLTVVSVGSHGNNAHWSGNFSSEGDRLLTGVLVSPHDSVGHPVGPENIASVHRYVKRMLWSCLGQNLHKTQAL
jgi:hypothetical protein